MTEDWINFALTVLPFTVSMSLTPGPNNVMVTASAANFGFRRTIPHMLGVAFGFPLMLLPLALGFGAVLAAYPQIHRALHWFGIAYLAWLAWRIATAGRAGPAARARPLTALEAALFQWINGKAWVIAVGAITTYTTVGGDLLLESAAIAALFIPVCLAALSIWAGFGTAIAGWLRSAAALRAFNIAMALLLVASLVPLVLE
jgi:threonine/homoserine/homoserine lactone efflux protein